MGPSLWTAAAGRTAPVSGGSRRSAACGLTPGDLLFHIRAKRMDLCFELATQFMARIGNAVSAVDEVQGFRYFDDRDLMGFVDGTENPRGAAATDAVLIGEEDAAFAGGATSSCKISNDLDAWNALSMEAQERIIGRTKLSENEASVYTVERNAWSIARRCEMHFRLTYERVFLPGLNLWRDFLVYCEEMGSPLPA